jgi:hypothetical protein
MQVVQAIHRPRPFPGHQVPVDRQGEGWGMMPELLLDVQQALSAL